MMEMRDNGRSLDSGKFQRGFMESWDGLGWEGTWDPGLLSQVPGEAVEFPVYPSICHVEFPLYPSVEFLESHEEFLVYPTWNSQCVPCGIPGVSQVSGGRAALPEQSFPDFGLRVSLHFRQHPSFLQGEYPTNSWKISAASAWNYLGKQFPAQGLKGKQTPAGKGT